MKAGEASFAFMGNEYLVEIPFFQRGYVWDKENWQDLLADLLIDTKSHFLGSLILKQHEQGTGKPKHVSVIDGQQRLTTLSILVKALYDTFPLPLKEQSRPYVRNVLFYKKYPLDEAYFVKIRHSHVDAAAYERIVTSGLDDDSEIQLEQISDEDCKILRCYAFFRDEVQKLGEKPRASLFNRILDQQSKMLVVIDLENQDNEQAIFDTINSAGVRLSSADTIKNALYQRAINLIDQDATIKLYKESWEKTFLCDEQAIAFWEAERITGRLKRDNIEILLHSIAVIKGFYDPDQDTLADLPDRYKKQIDLLKTGKELKDFVAEIVEYAEIYRSKLPTIDNSELLSFEDNVRRLLYILDLLDLSTFHPFILFVLKQYQNDEVSLTAILSDLEKVVIRRMIAKAETKSYNKLCKEFIASPGQIAKKASEVTDSDISIGLRSIANKHASLLLFWIELCRRAFDKKQGVKELKYCYSLEHVMPQKWTEHWSIIPEKKRVDGTAMNDDEAKKDRDEKVYWIGNMTLLTSSLNSSLRNYDFATKVGGQPRRKGMKAYAELSITRDDIISPFENGDSVWDETKIIARTAALEKEINQIWGLAKSCNTTSQ